MKNTSPYRIVTTLIDQRERMPLLVDQHGVPLFYPTLFITTQVRNAARAARTIGTELGAIKRLYVWARMKGLDIELRLQRRRYFTDSEIESLCQSAGRRLRQKKSQTHVGTARVDGRRAASRNTHVSGTSKNRNLMYIASYLRWLSRRLVERESGQLDKSTMSDIELMVTGVETRKPRNPRRSRVNAPKSLDIKEEALLLELVGASDCADPQSALAYRDQLIVHLLKNLGIRAGELLSLKVSDFDFGKNEVLIARRPDDPDDPRLNQPTAKTCDRLLPMSRALAKLVYDYVIGPRRASRRARGHSFLIVTHKRGPHDGIQLRHPSKFYWTSSCRRSRNPSPTKMGRSRQFGLVVGAALTMAHRTSHLGVRRINLLPLFPSKERRCRYPRKTAPGSAPSASQISMNSTTSIRRSPRSTFDMNVCVLSRRSAKTSWVTPARSLRSRSNVSNV